MRIALVFPRTRYPTGDPPLGLAYLAAVARKQTGRDPVVIDTTFSNAPMEMIASGLKSEKFDLVGVSAMVTMAKEAREAARIARQTNPRAVVVMGGPHPTTLPGHVLEEPAVDAVCMGEGEDTLADIVRTGGLEGVAGIFTRDGKGGLTGEPREYIKDLDRIPFPALELLPMQDYLNHWFQLDAIDPAMTGTSVLATRGCPFKCAYCQPTLDRLFGKGIRKRSPQNVVDELKLRRESLGVGAFMFADDTFIADRDWVGRFCRELGDRDLGLIWGCNVRADLVDAGLLGVMREAGLRKIYIGIEVFDDACRRDVFNKKLTRQEVESAIAAARGLGIRTQGYFMIGAPGESRSDVWNTVRYAWRLPLDDATFNITTPLPGTFLYDNHRERICAPEEEMDYYRRYAFDPERGLSQAWLNRMQKTAYAGFYARPRRLARQAAGLFSTGGMRRFGSKLRRVF